MEAATIAVIGIIATVIVALATLVVAYQTKRLAKSTSDLGTHAQRQVAEMETSRKLEWAPYLTFQPADGGDNLAGGVRALRGDRHQYWPWTCHQLRTRPAHFPGQIDLVHVQHV